ncbi:MAG: ABC transporter ATP-binding protein [Proteobacteria bacterium]|nr:ABC transporter ATP-binding protein [Pseudomonadota bacterium]
MAKVTLKAVNKFYPTGNGGVHAVKDLSAEIEDGEFVALLGPSGCGKTSTLRMIVGLEEVTSGEILFDDVLVNDLTPQLRNVAMAFETYALYPNMTVAENIGFPLEARGVKARERSRRVVEIAELLDIADILGQRPTTLSGGQQQRVSLGRALIREPAAFILDEVMSHVDAHLKFRMLFELKRIHRTVGRTMIYVTHDQMEALALADRVAVMKEGRLQQFATRDELFHRPANRFIAEFIGEPPTNFLTVRSEGMDGGVALGDVASGLSFEPSPERAASLTAGAEYILGIRPQNLTLDAEGSDASITARVEINEYLGERRVLTVSAGDTTLSALAPADHAVSPGAEVKLYYRRDDVMLFDAGSQELIG